MEFWNFEEFDGADIPKVVREEYYKLWNEYIKIINNMKTNFIPDKLHHLIPLVEKWGIEDDGYRDEAIQNAQKNELECIVNSISDDDAIELNTWLCNPLELNNPSIEYIKYTCYLMAFDYAKLLLKNNE